MNSELSPVGQLLAPIIKGMCNYPDDLQFIESRVKDGLLISIVPNTADAPILIGRAGRQINALRAIVREMGRVSGSRVDIELRDSFIGGRERREFKPRSTFPREEFMTNLRNVCVALWGQIPPLEAMEENTKLTVVIDVPETKASIVQGLNDAFYPYCYRLGRKLFLKVKNYTAVTTG